MINMDYRPGRTQKIGVDGVLSAAKFAIGAAFVIVVVYINAQKVPALEKSIQAHEVKISVIEAHYADILKSLERIEKRIR